MVDKITDYGMANGWFVEPRDVERTAAPSILSLLDSDYLQ